MRIFLACDPHGSQQTWVKMCQAPKVFKADVAMMCGDLTGKAIMPIIQEKENRWYAQPYGKRKQFKKQKDVDRFFAFQKDAGFYPYVMTPDELAALREKKGAIKELFQKLMSERMQEWLDMAAERIPPDVDIIVNPGNDDSWVIDPIIENHPRIIYPLKQVIDVHGYPLISCEWVNSTPWDTERECPDEELMEKLEEDNRKEYQVNPTCPVHGGAGSGFPSDIRQTTGQVTGHDNTQDKMMFSGSQHLLVFLKKEMSRAELMKKLGLSSRKNFVSEYLEPLLNNGLIERTIPDNPTSRNQLYRMTEKGQKLMLQILEELLKLEAN